MATSSSSAAELFRKATFVYRPREREYINISETRKTNGTCVMKGFLLASLTRHKGTILATKKTKTLGAKHSALIYLRAPAVVRLSYDHSDDSQMAILYVTRLNLAALDPPENATVRFCHL